MLSWPFIFFCLQRRNCNLPALCLLIKPCIFPVDLSCWISMTSGSNCRLRYLYKKVEAPNIIIVLIACDLIDVFTSSFNLVNVYGISIEDDACQNVRILILCNCKEDVKRKSHSVIDKFAERGLRSLAVAVAVARQEVPEKTKESPGEPWQLVGLLLLFDPPRHETIRSALHVGVNVNLPISDSDLPILGHHADIVLASTPLLKLELCSIFSEI